MWAGQQNCCCICAFGEIWSCVCLTCAHQCREYNAKNVMGTVEGRVGSTNGFGISPLHSILDKHHGTLRCQYNLITVGPIPLSIHHDVPPAHRKQRGAAVGTCVASLSYKLTKILCKINIKYWKLCYGVRKWRELWYVECDMFQNHFEEPGATLALVEHEKVLGTSGIFGVLPKLFKK